MSHFAGLQRSMTKLQASTFPSSAGSITASFSFTHTPPSHTHTHTHTHTYIHASPSSPTPNSIVTMAFHHLTS
ncbi:hypothetical protein L1987_62675 [Smallanthus sonchifolius]|uniref:Uncharacterized protein n=1 Tax=Smallanthus sonchifolius TaxID=185202 RepID=A0ACB9CBE3_9ASTR|nr:hypothetical protein L1987_62675 [Smallanthus sonchifolius]